MSAEKHNLQRQADRTKPSGKHSVFSYLAILFLAAFVLLLFSYLMDRGNDEAIDGLKDSVSAMQSAQEVYEENKALREQLDQLEDQLEQVQGQLQTTQNQVGQLEQQAQGLQQQIDALNLSTQALDWFWQINEAFVRERYTLTRELIEQMGPDLVQYLPDVTVTHNGRFSPRDRYQEIYDALY